MGNRWTLGRAPRPAVGGRPSDASSGRPRCSDRASIAPGERGGVASARGGGRWSGFVQARIYAIIALTRRSVERRIFYLCHFSVKDGLEDSQHAVPARHAARVSPLRLGFGSYGLYRLRSYGLRTAPSGAISPSRTHDSGRSDPQTRHKDLAYRVGLPHMIVHACRPV